MPRDDACPSTCQKYDAREPFTASQCPTASDQSSVVASSLNHAACADESSSRTVPYG